MNRATYPAEEDAIDGIDRPYKEYDGKVSSSQVHGRSCDYKPDGCDGLADEDVPGPLVEMPGAPGPADHYEDCDEVWWADEC